MKAKTVAQVIAAEAGGKTYAQRLSAMRDIASAVLNRANALGVSPEDVVGVTSEFNAYNNPMPAGTSRLTSLAEQALADVMSGGVTHNGMFYAREYATKNLPKGLKEVKKAVDGHVYFTDPKGRAIKTAVGVRPVQKSALPQTVAAIPSPAPRATPQQANALGMSAVGGTRDFMSSNMARVAKAAGTPPSTYAARITAPAPNAPSLLGPSVAAPKQDRLGYVAAAPKQDRLGYVAAAPKEGRLPGIANTETDVQRMEREQGMFQPTGKQDRLGTPSFNALAAPTAAAGALGSSLATNALGAPNALMQRDQQQLMAQRFAPTPQDMALAHLMPGLPPTDIQPAPIQVAQPQNIRTSSVKRAPLTLNVTKPADPFANKTIGGIKPDERFSVDSIDSAIGGPRGATFSASPSLATFSRGPNIGYGVHNAQTGMTTLFDPSGNITGARRDKSTGGGFLGGLFGGGSSSSGKSLGGGYGGGYGSSGNGNGGFGIGGAGSTRSR